MGRGRAKAKQTKVARKLKYSGGHTDLDRLRRELGVDEAEERDSRLDDEPTWSDDPYAAYEDIGEPHRQH